MSFFREMRRRNVYRVGAAYAIVGWLIVQIAATVFPNLDLPETAVKLVIVLVALGFPIALLLAWAFELTPDGVRLSRSAHEKVPVTSGRPLDYALLAGLVLVAGLLLVSPFRHMSVGEPGRRDAGTILIDITSFTDNSPDGGYEWLARGIASELRTALSGIDGIEVAPADLFSLGDQEAAALVDFVVEGDISVDGQTIRIYAGFTDVKAQRHQALLAKNYTRSETLDIQVDLTAQILPLLGTELGVSDVNAYAGAGTTDPEAYENYLRGLTAPGPEAMAFFREAVRIDDQYANAWAQLARLTTAQKWFALRPGAMLPMTEEGLEYAKKAEALEPGSAEVLAMLGTMHYGLNEWSQGYEYHSDALRLKRSPIALNQNAGLLFRAGNSALALSRVEEVKQSSMLQSAWLSAYQRALILLQLRRFDEVRELLPEMSSVERLDAELMLNLSTGITEDVRRSIATMASSDESGYPGGRRGEAAARLYRPLVELFDDSDAAVAFLRELHENEASWPSQWHDIGRLAAWFGDPEFAFELVAEEARNGSPRRYGLWMPYLRDVRALPVFVALVEEIGLVEFWDRHVWGDFCRRNDSGVSCNY